MNIQYIIFLIFCLFSCKQKKDEQKTFVKNSSVEKSNNDTILKELYPNKKIKNLIIYKDSLKSNELQISYYENGNLKEKGLIGIISNKDLNTKTSIETWFYYDSLKHLDSTIYYNNDEFKKDFIEKKRFFKNGKIKVIEKYNNYILYETDINPMGIWKFYNENGTLIKSINKGNYKN